MSDLEPVPYNGGKGVINNIHKPFWAPTHTSKVIVYIS